MQIRAREGYQFRLINCMHCTLSERKGRRENGKRKGGIECFLCILDGMHAFFNGELFYNSYDEWTVLR